MREIRMMEIPGIPLITEGNILGEIIVGCCQTNCISICDGDILIVAQKVVSKAEGATVKLSEITPTDRAIELAEATGRDARLCQVYLDEATEVLEVKGRMVITRHKLGFINSSSMVDRSNVAPTSEETIVLLPRNPDESARNIRECIKSITGKTIAVIINDSLGRADRDGSVGMAIGIAGISHLELRSQEDLFGNASNSRIDLVDELAAAGSILMGQADEATPVVIIRGANFTPDEHSSIRNLLFT